MADPDDHVRAATDRAILRERIALAAMFSNRPASLLERYFSEAVTLGLVRDQTRRDLADLLAEQGMADPDGRAAVTLLPASVDSEVVAAHRLAGLDMPLDEFRAEYHRRRRETIRPLSAREVAAQLALETPLRGSRSRSKRLLAFLRVSGRGRR